MTRDGQHNTLHLGTRRGERAGDVGVNGLEESRSAAVACAGHVDDA